MSGLCDEVGIGMTLVFIITICFPTGVVVGVGRTLLCDLRCRCCGLWCEGFNSYHVAVGLILCVVIITQVALGVMAVIRVNREIGIATFSS